MVNLFIKHIALEFRYFRHDLHLTRPDCHPIFVQHLSCHLPMMSSNIWACCWFSFLTYAPDYENSNYLLSLPWKQGHGLCSQIWDSESCLFWWTGGGLVGLENGGYPDHGEIATSFFVPYFQNSMGVQCGFAKPIWRKIRCSLWLARKKENQHFFFFFFCKAKGIGGINPDAAIPICSYPAR